MERSFVAFLDVLGFTDLVRANDGDTLLRLYHRLVTVTEASVSPGVRVIEREGERLAVPDVTKARVNLLIVSDSVIIYSPRPDMKGCIDVLAATRSLLWAGFCSGLPMRGAITFGPLASIDGESGDGMRIGTHSLLGQALVDARDAEAAQDWSGAILTEDAVTAYGDLCALHAGAADLATFEYLHEAGFVIDYAVPTTLARDEGRHTCVAVNWPRAASSRPSEAAIESAFGQHGKDPSRAQTKIKNTLDFLSACWPSS